MCCLKIKTTTILSAGIISICFLNILSAQEDFTKKISQLYNLDEYTKLNITNSYGNIDIQDWDKNEAKIDVEIIIHDFNLSRAEQAAKKINIDFSTDADEIIVNTNYTNEFFDIIGKNNPGDNKKFEVNYTIKIPSNLNINLNNKYGDVFISKLTSASIIDVKYGNFQANQLLANAKESMAELFLAYSKGNIESCKWLKLNLKYSRLNIEDSKALIAFTKYSKLFIQKGSSLVCDSKYDSYEVGVLSNFVANAQYSNFKFDAITKKISLDTKYSDVRVTEIPSSFESIQVENSYGTINLGVASEASYKLNGYAKYAKIDFPDDSRVNSFHENNEHKVDGIVGQGNTSLPTIQINTKYGGVRLTK
jgi:hypothetical protein